MNSLCASCPQHRTAITYNKFLQGLIIEHTCKKTGLILHPETKPITECKIYQDYVDSQVRPIK